jgi:DNA-binding NtrC family response regulator
VHVIVIDDEEMILSLAAKVLKRAGIDVSTAASGAEGLALVLDSPTSQLAIIDMTLPDIDGFELIRRIRGRRPDFPCIISTGHSVSSKDVPADLVSNLYLLPKPYRSQTLVDLVSKAAGVTPSQTANAVRVNP